MKHRTHTFQIDFVTIGDPGNLADTSGKPNPAGSVDYAYRIGKYEVSREMIERVNASDGLGITMSYVDPPPGNIPPDLPPWNTPRPEMPAGGITWNEAARFVNWLNTSQGYSPAYKFGTQPGDAGYDANANIELWQAGDPGYDQTNRFRNGLAHYFLPSADEWYKAAYYDPNANDGAGGYWDYPTGRDSPPTDVAGGMDAATAVFKQVPWAGPADITNAGGLSPYGTMAQGGNVREWEETESDLVNDDPTASDGTSSRGKRGGAWRDQLFLDLNSLARGSGLPSLEAANIAETGFRVASVPEPNALLLLVLGVLGSPMTRRRSR